MYKMPRLLIFVLLSISPVFVLADEHILTYYDSGFYDETGGVGPGGIPAGYLVGVSDIFYSFYPLDSRLYITQTEWLSDGAGNEYKAPYDHSLVYENISFSNFYEYGILRNNDVFMNKTIPLWRAEMAEYIATNQNVAQEIVLSKNLLINQNIQIANIASNHKTGRIGRNAGDSEFGAYSWGQALYGHGKKTGQDSFSSDTMGFVLGLEKIVSDSLNIGVGYGYSDTSSATDIDKISADNGTVFLYSNYTDGDFFTNGVFAYSFGDYKYTNTNQSGKSKSYFASFVPGIKIDNGSLYEVGFRYNHINLKNKDVFESSMQDDIFTVLVAGGYEYYFDVFCLGGKATFSYDLINPDSNVKIFWMDQVFQKHIPDNNNPFGAEFNAWLEYKMPKTRVNLEYFLSFQSHYINNTGRISFKYGF